MERNDLTADLKVSNEAPRPFINLGFAHSYKMQRKFLMKRSISEQFEANRKCFELLQKDSSTPLHLECDDKKLAISIETLDLMTFVLIVRSNGSEIARSNVFPNPRRTKYSGRRVARCAIRRHAYCHA